MTLTNMHYFMAVARELSFTKAAQQLHITQQSLSANIASLEEELGSPLFVRHIPLELTYAGEVFLRYATEFEQNLKIMKHEFSDIAQNQQGILRIGISPTRGRMIMPELIKDFQKDYPNISIELKGASNAHLYENLLNGEIDLAIANFSDNLKGIELQEFYKEEVVLFVSRQMLLELYGENAAAVMRMIHDGNISFLETCPLVMGNPEDIGTRIGLTVLRSSNIRPQIKAKVDNAETQLAFCIQGIGACFCPENLAQATLSPEQIEKLEIIRLGNVGKYQIRLGYLKQSYQWSMISEFIKFLKMKI